MRTRLKNRVHDVIDRQGLAVSPPTCSDMFGKAGSEWLRQVALPASERCLLDELLSGIAFLEKQIRSSDRRIKEMFDNDPVAQRLKTIPGIGVFFSTLIRLELDDIRRFPSPEKLHAYAGLVPSTYQSGDTLRHGRLTKQGNHWLRWAMVEAVVPAIRSNTQLAHLHAQQKARKNDVRKANIVLARRLLTIVYRVWTQERVFEPYRKEHEKNRAAFSAL
jgi:transposase